MAWQQTEREETRSQKTIRGMLRKVFVDKYNDEMVEAFSELFNTARKKMFHPEIGRAHV